MVEEKGVMMINGSDPTGNDTPPRSRSVSPTRSTTGVSEVRKEKRFLNGWSKQQEILMADWSDLAMSYRWLHDKSEKHFHIRNLRINLPVIMLTTLGGTANFGIQSLFTDNTSKQYASFVIGGISLLAGLMTTMGNYLRYAQLEESHRVASIAWGKFQRLIAVELAMKPDDRMDSMDFLKICRADLDRLIEQSPPIPETSIEMFKEEFGSISDLKKPDICGELEHTRIFESSESRLKQVLGDAALMLRHKRNALNELLSPQIQETIKKQVDARLQEALEERKKSIEEEIAQQKQGMQQKEEEFQRLMEERQKKIHQEIDSEIETHKKKRPDIPSTFHSKFESRLQLTHPRGIQPPDRRRRSETAPLAPQNIVIIPSSEPQDKDTLHISIDS